MGYRGQSGKQGFHAFCRLKLRDKMTTVLGQENFFSRFGDETPGQIFRHSACTTPFGPGRIEPGVSARLSLRLVVAGCFSSPILTHRKEDADLIWVTSGGVQGDLARAFGFCIPCSIHQASGTTCPDLVRMKELR